MPVRVGELVEASAALGVRVVVGEKDDAFHVHRVAADRKGRCSTIIWDGASTSGAAEAKTRSSAQEMETYRPGIAAWAASGRAAVVAPLRRVSVLMGAHPLAIAALWLTGFAVGLGVLFATHRLWEPPAIGTNLIENPSFERDTRFWSEWMPGTTATQREATVSRSGSFSLRVAPSASAPYGVHALWIAAPVQAGVNLTLGLWVKGSGSALGQRVAVQVKAEPQHGAGGALTEEIAPRGDALITRVVTLTGRWQHVAASVRVRGSLPSDLDLLVLARHDIALGDVFYLDDASLVAEREGHR